MALPPFIELPGSSVYQHPFMLKGMNSQVFVLHADFNQLVKTTDKWLNSVPGSEYRYVPLLPFVYCSPIWIEQITWSPEGKGWNRETDFSFGYYVACFKGAEFRHIAVAQAYLIVDNPLAAFAGREIFGYRKAFGTMDYVAGTYQPQAVSTWVSKKWAPDEEVQNVEVARINFPEGWGAATRLAKFEDLLKLAELAIGDLVLDAVTGITRLIEHFKAGDLPVVYVLQLRDVQYPTQAGFQALIESPMEITKLNSAWFLPDGFSIRLTNYASYPLISDLGIKVDANSVAKSVLSFQMNWDCNLLPGTVLALAGRTTTS
ncbi:MAG TPA: hypothetical protein VGQ36_07900 [Thermoanaerobaculia bacterium]|nr:hypothetical protein [Thermoanaerobaculia bacterium]